ncbi:hypothetical protein Rain11_1713 [Raineya orbicola]|uniref:Uncharacterized protein n=2 Tax=Raineya orbicola TaxID=2016530 RepID=A0A2N3ID98_9BACT|nr:hypothetical protein Rain11_1713 [Raineya orbicola]
MNASNISQIIIGGQLRFSVTGGLHIKSLGGLADTQLNNPDTINITSISYNSSTGILTLNLQLQDHSGNADGNGNAVAQVLNGNTGAASGTINMQIPVTNATSRTL